MSIDRRILIADDDAEVRGGAAELLSAMGLIIIEAGSGVEAVEIMRAGPIHLALLDYHMPGHDGLEVFSIIREETLEIPCMFWSGDAPEPVREVALRQGASAFLQKPVQPDLLRGEVRRILETHWGWVA